MNLLERLGMQLESADRIAHDWARQNVELRAEIDGVKYTMAYEQSRSETLQAEIKALKAENEQLRISVADFKQFAEAAHRATDERDAEIERLRRIMRDVLRSPWPPPPSWYAEAKEAAGDALGDAPDQRD